MMQEKINKQIAITTIFLIVVICIFEFTNLDIFIQSFFYDFNTKTWLIDKNEPILKLFFYDGFKKIFILFSILILISLIFFRKTNLIKEYKKGLLIVLLSTIFVPTIVVSLKNNTNTPCPCNLATFGGDYPNIKVFDSYPKDFIQESKIKCWPAGHASMGFSLMALFFLFKTASNQKKALITSIILGFITGSYKMLLGDHFLSHTLVTMILSWLTILIIVKILKGKELEKPTKI